MKLIAESLSRPNAKRSNERTAHRILGGALRAMADIGQSRLSMKNIVDASGLSKATVYKYYSNKTEILSALSELICSNFEEGIRKIADENDDAFDRLRAIMFYYAQFTTERTPERMFEIEPEFYLFFFRTHFQRHKMAIKAALDPSLDYVDIVTGLPLNSDLFAECLLRWQLSTIIVPANGHWLQFWMNIPDIIERYVTTLLEKRR